MHALSPPQCLLLRPFSVIIRMGDSSKLFVLPELGLRLETDLPRKSYSIGS